MQNYKVMVISKENLNAIIYVGPEDREHMIYLYSHDLVTSLSAIYKKLYSCEKCLKGYDDQTMCLHIWCCILSKCTCVM